MKKKETPEKKKKEPIYQNKTTLTVYLVLRALVIFVLVRAALRRDFESVFMCGLTLVLMILPMLLFSQAECRTADHAGGHHSAVHLRGRNIGRAEQLLCPRAQLGYDAAHPQRLSVRGHRVRAGRSAQRKRAFFLQAVAGVSGRSSRSASR